MGALFRAVESSQPSALVAVSGKNIVSIISTITAFGAVERGIRQIVILGAGLDTFALRNPHGARQILIYEVDHPATQAWKRRCLAEAQLTLPPWLILVPVDFERDALGEKLVSAGFQQNSPAFFTWLGVVPYLTQDAIGSTLDYMASIQNSEVVFDYMEPSEAFSEEIREYVTERTEMLWLRLRPVFKSTRMYG